MRKNSLQLSDVIDRNPILGLQYYYIEFLGNPDGTSYASTQTQWVGWASRNPDIEIRKARFVNPQAFIELYRQLEIPLLVVNTLDDAATFLGYGGAAIVTEELAKNLFDWVLEEDTVLPRGLVGFISVLDSHTDLKKRTPSRKLRMRVLKRDRLRCRICGRSAESSVDIELHVHHIRPVSKGGATFEENLITLCAACHGGLDPHYDPDLHMLVEGETDLKDDFRQRILKGATQYRKNFDVQMRTIKGLPP
jgi:HNH endonuclease